MKINIMKLILPALLVFVFTAPSYAIFDIAGTFGPVGSVNEVDSADDDAMNVRYEAGKHAHYINSMRFELNDVLHKDEKTNHYHTIYDITNNVTSTIIRNFEVTSEHSYRPPSFLTVYGIENESSYTGMINVKASIFSSLLSNHF